MSSRKQKTEYREQLHMLLPIPVGERRTERDLSAELREETATALAENRKLVLRNLEKAGLRVPTF